MKKNVLYWLLVTLLSSIVSLRAYAEESTGIVVEPAETTVTMTWPTDPQAQSYQLDIYHNGAVFCRLTLGANGQLLDIAFKASGRKMSNVRFPMSNADNSQPNTLSFMVTGLDAASRYNYVLSVLDANGKPLHVYIGDFATLGYSGELQGSHEVIPTPPIIPGNPEATTFEGLQNPDSQHPSSSPSSRTKFFHNGQLFILHNDKLYTPSGQTTPTY